MKNLACLALMFLLSHGLFVHASGWGRQVMVSNLFTPRNWNIFVGARR